MPVTATVTVIESNVSGQTGSVPPDAKNAPAAGRLPKGAPLYYDATTAGGDPDWPGISSEIRSALPGQPNRTIVQVLLTASGITDSSVCSWELFNLPEKAAADVRAAGESAMAVTSFQKPTTAQTIRGVRPGRRLLAVGVDPANPTKYYLVPQYQDFPAPVFRRVNGQRVVVDLPIPDRGEQFQFIVDLHVPGVPGVPVAGPVIQVAVAADGTVDVNSPPEEGMGVSGLMARQTSEESGPEPEVEPEVEVEPEPEPEVEPEPEPEPEPETQDSGDVPPTMANSKAEIIDYLLAHGFDQEDLDGLTKSELLELID